MKRKFTLNRTDVMNNPGNKVIKSITTETPSNYLSLSATRKTSARNPSINIFA